MSIEISNAEIKDILYHLKRNINKLDLYDTFKVDNLEDITDKDIEKYIDIVISTYLKEKFDYDRV